MKKKGFIKDNKFERNFSVIGRGKPAKCKNRQIELDSLENYLFYCYEEYLKTKNTDSRKG
jgi:hypothetical protein